MSDMVTLEMLGTVGGSAAAVTAVTQGIKYFAKKRRYKSDPKTIAFFVSLAVAFILLIAQEEITVISVLIAIINAFVVWLTARGAFDFTKETGEALSRKDESEG